MVSQGELDKREWESTTESYTVAREFLGGIGRAGVRAIEDRIGDVGWAKGFFARV